MKKSISLAVISGRDEKNIIRFMKSIEDLLVKPEELIVISDLNHCNYDMSLYLKDLPLSINLVYMEYDGASKQPAMRNLALNLCSSSFIWFVDDDVSLHPQSLGNLKELIQDLPKEPSIGCVAGKIIEDKGFDLSKIKKPIEFHPIKGPVGLFDIDNQKFPLCLYDVIVTTSGKKYPIVDFAQGTSMAFDVAKLKSVRGFDESLGVGYSSYEDSEVSLALLKKGHRTIYASQFELIHHKLPRIAGVGRGNADYIYNKYLVRNHTISIFKNSYPSLTKSPFYVISFMFLQTLRCIRSNSKTPTCLSIQLLITPLKCSFSIGTGFLLGCKEIVFTRAKRVNKSL